MGVWCLHAQEAGSLASSVQAVEIDTPYGPLHITVQVLTAQLLLFKLFALLLPNCLADMWLIDSSYLLLQCHTHSLLLLPPLSITLARSLKR